LGISHYSKIKNGQQKVSVELLDDLFKYYGVSIDHLHLDSQVVPQEIIIEDKTTSEQARLIAELDEKDQSIIFGLIETMLTKKKFKDFFNKKCGYVINTKGPAIAGRFTIDIQVTDLRHLSFSLSVFISSSDFFLLFLFLLLVCVHH
jgi:hypothetical protein